MSCPRASGQVSGRLGAVERPGGGAGVDLAQRRQGLSVAAVDVGVPDAVTVTDVWLRNPRWLLMGLAVGDVMVYA